MNFASWSGSAESALEVGCLPHGGHSTSQVQGTEWQDQLTVIYGGSVNNFCAGNWLCFLSHAERSKQVLVRTVYRFNYSL